MSLVSENIAFYRVYADFRDGSPGRGVNCQMAVGSSMTAIFGDFGGYFFGTLQIRVSVLHGDMLPMKFVAK